MNNERKATPLITKPKRQLNPDPNPGQNKYRHNCLNSNPNRRRNSFEYFNKQNKIKTQSLEEMKRNIANITTKTKTTRRHNSYFDTRLLKPKSRHNSLNYQQQQNNNNNSRHHRKKTMTTIITNNTGENSSRRQRKQRRQQRQK